MNKKTLWITETAVMLALLIALQYATSFVPKPAGQFVTGSCVNAVLAVTALVAGLSSSLVVALVSPWCAYLLGIAPADPLISAAIMVGNAMFVIVLYFVRGKGRRGAILRSVIAWPTAAVCKFATLYLLVAKLLAVVMNRPVAAKVIPMFTWPQLVTALIGGGIALLIAPALKKALKK